MQQMQQELQKAVQAAESKQGEIELKRAELDLKGREMAMREAELSMKADELRMKQAEGANGEAAELDRMRAEFAIEVERQRAAAELASLKVQNEAMKLDFERKLFEATKQIAILQMQSAETATVHAIESAENELSRAGIQAQHASDIDTMTIQSLKKEAPEAP